ncbi:glycosyltransferase [Yinghuangia seranimata]|uniref:glycosyltransferase n=1 Tax=Yinghuangia seranimata TaxID=408067 RepID=UPI00248C9819|nr:glycosyltransferase [Yinghuangia seranimata]MDI2132180.1 glycosyltransferase [Yinghuangia seranimata]
MLGRVRRVALRPLPSALLLLAVAAATHVPSFLRAFWNPDEGFLATQARMLGAGADLYTGVVDRKPPALPYLYTAVFQVFGPTALWPVKLLAVGAHTATAGLLLMLAARRYGRPAGLAAGLLYLVASIGLAPPDAQAANFEVFILPATAAALVLADRGRYGWAGVAVAAAALTKQSGAAVLLPVAYMAWRAGVSGGRKCERSGQRDRPGAGPETTPGPHSRTHAVPGRVHEFLSARAVPGRVHEFLSARTTPGRVRKFLNTHAALGRLLLGAVLPVALIAPLFGAGRFLFWVVTASSGYASLNGGWLQALARASGNLGIVVAAGLPLVWAAWRGRRTRADADLWLWLAVSAVAVAAGTRFFGHYYLQLLPPLVVLGVGGVARGALRMRYVAAYALLSTAVFTTLALTWPQARLDHIRDVAATIRAQTRPDQPLLVWGMNPTVYYYAERPPATRFLTAGFLTNFAGGRPPDQVGQSYAVPGAWAQFTADVTRTRPTLVVDDSGHAPYRPERIPRFEEFLRTNYREVARSGSTVIYRRITP